MTDQDCQEPSTRSLPIDVEPLQGVTSTPAVETWQKKLDPEVEKQHEARLRDLRQCICELLMKNQQLREQTVSIDPKASREAEIGGGDRVQARQFSEQESAACSRGGHGLSEQSAGGQSNDVDPTDIHDK